MELRGRWIPRYVVTPADDESSIRHEIHRQLDTFVRIVGRPPTHIDSHQHVHRNEPVTQLLADAGGDLGVPVRDMASGITYTGAFYGQDGRGYPVPRAISVESLVSLIEQLPEGITELGCHPGTTGTRNGYSGAALSEPSRWPRSAIRESDRPLSPVVCSSDPFPTRTSRERKTRSVGNDDLPVKQF